MKPSSAVERFSDCTFLTMRCNETSIFEWFIFFLLDGRRKEMNLKFSFSIYAQKLLQFVHLLSKNTCIKKMKK